jgi:hypothetical protein
VENGAEVRKRLPPENFTRRAAVLKKETREPAISANFLISPYATRVKTGNWHVFPIDNLSAWARMAIAGARA